MTFRLGLTGSIGMGKSTTAKIFEEFNVPVWDADAAVHQLYLEDSGLILALKDIAPEAVSNGAVDRTVLSKLIKETPRLLKEIESVVHPAVAKNREAFVGKHETAPLIVLDIPLIFEKDQADKFDGVLVVTTSAEEQRRRVLSRRDMSEEKLDLILANQVPDTKKREQADFVIETKSLEYVRQEVQTLINKITGS